MASISDLAVRAKRAAQRSHAKAGQILAVPSAVPLGDLVGGGQSLFNTIKSDELELRLFINGILDDTGHDFTTVATKLKAGATVESLQADHPQFVTIDARLSNLGVTNLPAEVFPPIVAAFQAGFALKQEFIANVMPTTIPLATYDADTDDFLLPRVDLSGQATFLALLGAYRDALTPLTE